MPRYLTNSQHVLSVMRRHKRTVDPTLLVSLAKLEGQMQGHCSGLDDLGMECHDAMIPRYLLCDYRDVLDSIEQELGPDIRAVEE